MCTYYLLLFVALKGVSVIRATGPNAREVSNILEGVVGGFYFPFGHLLPNG